MVRHHCLVLLIVLLASSAAFAQDEYGGFPATADFSLGIGYANISVGDEALENEDALKFDPSLTFSIVPGLYQLRAGFAVGVSMVLDNSQRTIISNDGNLIVTGRSDVPLWLAEPEARLSWRQHFGESYAFFIEPGIAAGWTYASLDIEDDVASAGDNSYSKSDWTWHTRVFLRLGARMPGGYGGVEASWLRGGDLDLADNAQGELEEFYIGIFGSLLF